MEELNNEILDRIEKVLDNLSIDCPDCEGLYDDDQYTCTTCWCEGGNGTLKIKDYVKITI